MATATAKPKKLKVITNSALKPLVISEAKKLRKNTTSVEKSKLSFARLETRSSERCIYGQMVGNCFDARAIDLIELSCNRVLSCVNTDDDDIQGALNGSPKQSERTKYWSPIEVFIDRKRNKENGNNQRLIAFIKGETETLELK